MSGSRVRDANGVSADITDTANTAVIAAPGANKRLRIQWITVTNQHADVDPVVSLKNGSTEFDHVQVDALDIAGPHSIRLWYGEMGFPLAINTALNAANETNSADTVVSAGGYVEKTIGG
jgi:hypothetical protein